LHDLGIGVRNGWEQLKCEATPNVFVCCRIINTSKLASFRNFESLTTDHKMPGAAKPQPKSESREDPRTHPGYTFGYAGQAAKAQRSPSL
jgi:hypothetical protein